MKRLSLLISIIILTIAGPAGAAKVVSMPEPGPGDSLWMGVPASLDIYIENDTTLGAMCLGFQVWSPDGATWQWQDVGGLGTLTHCVTANPDGRLDPAAGTGSFDMTGLLVTEQNIDEMGRDTIMFGGVAYYNGLPPGPLQRMISCHYIPDGPDPEAKYTICFDSCHVPPSGGLVFVDLYGTTFIPAVTWDPGGVCWPVAMIPPLPCPEWDMGNPTAMTVDHCGSNSVTLSATGFEQNAIFFQLNSHTGSGAAQVIDNGDGTCQVAYTATAADVGQAVSIVVDVKSSMSSWGDCETWTLDVNVTNNPPTIDCGASYNPVCNGTMLTKSDIVSSDLDGCDILTYNLCGASPAPIGMLFLNAFTGEFTFMTDVNDIGTYTICVKVTDGIDVTECYFEVDVFGCQQYQIAIEKEHDVLQGHYVDVDVCLNWGFDPMGGFDFLIGYDASALTFTEAALGDYFIDCGWEYFTYRYNWNGNCGNACPTGLVRLIGLAETNNGPNHPDWGCLVAYEPGQELCGCGTVIATLTFFVSQDRTLECMFVPIKFYWMDCNDNSISGLSGDTLSVNYRIYDYLGGDPGYQEIQDYDFGVPGYYGIPDDPCMQGDKEVPIRFIDFCNGGIDIVCSDSIDARGDINVNGVPNEIADAVMFTNYFITGIGAFGSHYEASTAASDVNADGIALSVADLVYLVRVIVGDANPYPKPLPEGQVTISERGGTIKYNSPVNLGAVLLTFRVIGEAGSPQLGPGAAGMDLKYARQGDELRVLVYNIGTGMIPAGENTLITVPGEVELIGAEAATFEGVGIDALVRTLPTEFEVSNYPNPFNPKTTISLDLPSASEWSVEIYNVAGQLIRKYSGYSEAGVHCVEWDGTDNNGAAVASGIYVYRVQAGQYSATRKMMLMK